MTGGPPSPLLTLTELPRAIAELGSLSIAAPLLAGAPRGDGHPVIVLPGFLAGDSATAILRTYLRLLGYDAHRWELGRNLGPRSIGAEGEHLLARLHAVHADTDQQVSLVGWSLGGIMARLIARQAPAAVRQVITLGSPFAGNPRATRVWRAYEVLAGHRIDDPDTRRRMEQSAAPLPMPSTAIYSREDGIVPWQDCFNGAADNPHNLAVYGSHWGLCVNPTVLYAIADRLARPADDTTPFERSGWRAFAYPA